MKETVNNLFFIKIQIVLWERHCQEHKINQSGRIFGKYISDKRLLYKKLSFDEFLKFNNNKRNNPIKPN